MGETTGIEWTDSTFNAWIGCTKISPACDHCYAEHLMSTRYGRVEWGPHGKRVRTSPSNWRKPIQWHRDGARFQHEHGHRQRVFSASLSDWLDNQVDREWRHDLCDLIEATPNLDWLLLTKRPENFSRLAPSRWWRDGCPPNVWIGVTAEDQTCFDRRWAVLRTIGAVVRFISYEPASGPLRIIDESCPDWIISGGESPQGHVPLRSNPQWYRDIRDDCLRLGIAYFHKQYGNYASNPHCYEEGRTLRDAEVLDPSRNGKGGGLLDGRLWRQFPEPKPWRSAATAAAQHQPDVAHAG